MEALTVDNQLGLPRDQNNHAHQLRLRRLDGTEAARRTALCTPVLEHLAMTNQGILFFNGIHQAHQVAAILIIEQENTHTRLEHFIQVPPANRHAALFEGQYKNENAEIVFQEMGLGIITNFISLRASIGCPERLGPIAGPGPGATGAAGGAAPVGMEPAGKYDQAFCFRKMQAEDMKNAKQFLQMGPL